MVDVCFKEMDLEDFLETHGFLNYDLLSENPVLGAKTVVFDDEVGWTKMDINGGKSWYS